ncbi:MAG: hypothetical protein ACETWB_02570, partial [Anaerolineae bacterium]
EAWGLAFKEGRGVWRARVGIAILIALYLVFAYYIYLAFIQRRPEYIWTYPAHRNAFYWTPYRELPEAAFFGFPYRAGWKAIGGLYGAGVLEGDYGSNEEGEITAWYARGALRSYCDDPEYYIIADRVRDERLGRPDPLAKGYVPAGAVSVDGKPRLRLYRRAPANGLSAVYEAVEYEAAFDLGTRPEAVAHQPAPDHPLRADLGHRVRLLGYDLKATQARPGDILVLTLYWQAIAPMSVDYSVFVHLESDRIWGQRDGLPLCGFYRTSDWRPGDVVVERYRVPIDSATPAGEYPLQVGMYDPLDGRRLEVFGERGEALGNSIFLERIMISGD